MKVAQADILIVPGYTNSGPDHWQSRWQARLSTARRVEQDAWAKPVREDWVARFAETVSAAEKPVVVIAHSLGVATVVQSLPDCQDKIAGAFLVAPPEVDNPQIRPRHLMTFGPYRQDPLPMSSLGLRGGRKRRKTIPFGSYEHAGDMAIVPGGSMLVDPAGGRPTIPTREVRPRSLGLMAISGLRQFSWPRLKA